MSFYQEEERIIEVYGVQVSNRDYSIDYLTHKVTSYKLGIHKDEEKELKKLFFIKDKEERVKKIERLNDENTGVLAIEDTLESYEYIIRSIIEDIGEEEAKNFEEGGDVDFKKLDNRFQLDQYLSYVRRFGEDCGFFITFSCLDYGEPLEWEQIDEIINDFNNISCFGAELFRGVEKREEIRRIWVLELYIEKIIQTAKSISNSDKYKAICYLIDEQYKIHKNVVCGTIEDIFLRAHINYIIFEAIEIYLNNIDSEATEKTKELIPKRKYEKKNLLKWNSKKSAIGTLFGVLHQEGIIQGSKADLARELANMFGNLSESTLIDNIGLKEDKENYKPKYDTETQELMSKWVTFLKSCTPKQG
ncbi:hypothetical protein AX766_03960 [Flavobacterium covae]|uniref:hypothetical protein n=1 Tax=Flavobacterium covae TaxID=2906076 RepID=UPI0007C1D7C9|nr:hypothetical protein [Flavobacterium covae]AND63620.1 hypothetical protein AX766_03960 [Flavobacterium covae]